MTYTAPRIAMWEIVVIVITPKAIETIKVRSISYPKVPKEVERVRGRDVRSNPYKRSN